MVPVLRRKRTRRAAHSAVGVALVYENKRRCATCMRVRALLARGAGLLSLCIERRESAGTPGKNHMPVSPTAEIIADIRAGKMVILVDEEDRENEGDLVLAADFVTPDAINFMARFGRGLICLTLTEDKCRSLNLPLMVARNNSPLGTNFTVSIEAAHSVTTGISAADRARTVQAAVRADAAPQDIVQPGHVFPLMS